MTTSDVVGEFGAEDDQLVEAGAAPPFINENSVVWDRFGCGIDMRISIVAGVKLSGADGPDRTNTVHADLDEIVGLPDTSLCLIGRII